MDDPTDSLDVLDLSSSCGVMGTCRIAKQEQICKRESVKFYFMLFAFLNWI